MSTRFFHHHVGFGTLSVRVRFPYGFGYGLVFTDFSTIWGLSTDSALALKVFLPRPKSSPHHRIQPSLKKVARPKKYSAPPHTKSNMLQKVDLKSEKLDFFVGMKKSSPTHLQVNPKPYTLESACKVWAPGPPL